jgi:ubiquinone/menaquinone biosynthesis C-methylase UbiE
VENLEQMASTAGFQALRDTILDLACLRPEECVLDIGAGTGLLTLAAAPHVTHVAALDISAAMCHRLQNKLAQAGIGNVEVLVESATELPFGEASLDVVISNYCFHHLADADKRRTLAEIERVLRPGGRLVFADMMFQLSVMDRRDRAVIGKLVRRMLNRGPAGLLRIARNATRIATGRWEHPTRVQWWQEALLAAGFVDVAVRALDHEGGIASARKAE